MIMKANKQIGFIYKNNESIDKILKDGDVVFERGFLREKTSTTLPITFDGVGKDLKNYKTYGNTVQKILPDGYTQVDYIESGGNQYINTGVNADSNLSIKMNFSSSYHIQQRHMGAIKNDNGVYIRYHITLNGSGASSYLLSYSGQTNSAQNLLSTIDDNKHYLNLDIYNKKISVDEETPIDLTLQPFDTGLNYWLFARNSNNSTNMSFAIMRIYDCKMFYNDVLVRNFIPCYRNSDNEVGMYDLVNDAFYTNQGTGTFTYGSIAPTPDAPIEMVSCGDRTKNLFDINLSQSISNATKSVDGNNLTITCNVNNQNCYVSYDTSNINPNKTYYFSYTAVADNYAGVMIRAYKNDNTYEVVVDFTQTTEANLNFNVPDNTVYLRTFLYASRSTTGGSIGDKTIYSNVHLGEEPYGYKIPVNVRSDNLFDKDNANTFTGYITSTKISGSGQTKTLYIPCKSNTSYTVLKTLSARFIVGTTGNTPIIDESVIDYLSNNTATKLTITTSANAKYLCVYYYHSSYDTLTEQQILDSIMIVEGSTVPDKYIPYYNETTNIYLDEPLRKTKDGTYVDYIDFINQKVYRQLGRTEISDYSSFSVNAIPARFIQYLTPAIENLKLNIRDGISFEESYFFCNYIRMFGGSTATSKIRINILHEYLGTTSSSTSSEAKQALINLMSGKTMEFVYPLETPTEESITLPNIPTIDENNTLDIETEITPSQVYIKYKSNT